MTYENIRAEQPIDIEFEYLGGSSPVFFEIIQTQYHISFAFLVESKCQDIDDLLVDFR
jgi:hypothetical protein